MDQNRIYAKFLILLNVRIFTPTVEFKTSFVVKFTLYFEKLKIKYNYNYNSLSHDSNAK